MRVGHISPEHPIMSLDSFLHFISSPETQTNADSDLAFAEVSPEGKISSINPFGRLAWGWRVGTKLNADILMALEGVEGDDPIELPLMMGGLHLRGLLRRDDEGWFIIGYESGAKVSSREQHTFRTFMDQIPQPALCFNTSGLARYVNESAARELDDEVENLIGQPVLAQLINAEDRWKLADLIELAAKDGSSHASVRFGRSSQIGILHVVHSVEGEFQAVILPVTEKDNFVDGSYIQESFYQSFLEQGPIGVLYLDAAGSVTFENHYFRTLVGAGPHASWLGMELKDIVALPSAAAEELTAVCTTGNASTLMTDLIDPVHGSASHYVQIHASAIRHLDGNIIGVALLIEDRTEVVAQQEELDFISRSDQLELALRELATTNPDPSTFRDQAVVILGSASGADRTSLLALSIGKDRLVQISSWERGSDTTSPESISRDKLAEIEARDEGCFVRAAAGDHAIVCNRYDAGICWIDPVRDNGKFAGYLVFAWNNEDSEATWATSTRLNDWARLFESLYSWIQLGARYRTTVASIDDALFGFSFLPDDGRRYHFATDQFEMLTGYRSEELLDDGDLKVDWVSDVVHGEDAALVRVHNKTLLQGNESRVTYRIHHRDGSIRWLREHATPRTDSTGMTAVNGIISDVSEQKVAELVLLQAKREAEASDRSKTAFIATLSHEIRTPLGAVSGYAQLLQKELEEFEEELPGDLPDQVHEFVSAISERSHKLLNLVHDLFELSNLEMGKASIEQSSIELGSIVRAAVEKARPGIERKGLSLELSVHDSDLNVTGEAKRLSQVFDNLLSNAAKFTESGSIHVDMRRIGGEIRVEVIDTGIGISVDYQEQLFDSFSQEEDWRNRRFEGTGLGLSLVRQLLGLMGGSIEVESEKGSGSTFRVILPMLTHDLRPDAARYPSRI